MSRSARVVGDPGSRAPRPLRAAVIGTGFVGPFHVDAVRRGGYGTVVALAGSDPVRTAARADALCIDRVATAQEVFGDPSIDIVHVCTPNRTHAELAAAAIEAGKHVVIEKPVAMSFAEARGLADLADRHDRHVAVAYTYRGYPMVRRARALVEANELGVLRLVHGAYLQDWLASESDYNWRLEPETSGESRAVADIGSHWFDTVEYISGMRVESVIADLATFIPIRRRPLARASAFDLSDGPTESVAIRSEDAATILMRFEGGARGAVVVSQVSPGLKNAFSFQVAGSERTIDWNQEDPEHLWLRDRERSQLLSRNGADSMDADVRGTPSLPAGHPEGWSEALRDLLRAFYRAIADDEPRPSWGEVAPYPTIDDGVRGLAFVEAVLKSHRTQSWTPIRSA